MIVVFFSDAHGNQYAVRSLFKVLEQIDYDLCVFGGDIFGYYYGQAEILKLLQTSNCHCILGNHDRYFLDLLDGKRDNKSLVDRYGLTYMNIEERISEDDIAFLRSLNSRYDITVDGKTIVFVHGSIVDSLEGRVYPDAKIIDVSPYESVDYVFMGHTHHKMVKTLSNGTVLINPGSIGQPRDGKGCSFAILDTITQEISFKTVDYDRESLVNDIYSNNEDSIMEDRLIEVLFRDKH